MDGKLNYLRIGKNIRVYRKSTRMTQDKKKKKAGISLSFYGHIERGTRKASIQTLVQIAESLNVSVDELLADAVSQVSMPHRMLSDPIARLNNIRLELDKLEEHIKERQT